MKDLKTPDEWTAETKIYSKTVCSDSTYNFDSAVYSKIPSVIELCWQPIESSSDISERGLVDTSVYQAVVYDNSAINKGDLVQVNKLGWLEVQSIKRFPSYRLVNARTTERRCCNV